MQNAAAEQRLLKFSIAVTIVLASVGVVFGLLSGSMSIVFDGVFSAIDAAMSCLALLVARLVGRVADNRRGFNTYTSYVAKVGRAQFIEIHVAVPAETPIDNVGKADAIRREIGEGDRRRGAEPPAHDRLYRRSKVAVDGFDLLAGNSHVRGRKEFARLCTKPQPVPSR